ncbi:hypothetical protein [uncultured Vibrio sp.]|uniref:hypothetical protein n=1 Tax=uncultured Vibrio sp. TaxID=114054 RepID=UPI000912244C|nr:hypothetical protein [uncultured Vibrio sp.]OIQ26522.1 MAG: hypothetical protein BM561_01860 [Vibrio sp. MedPE-SWchi]
MPEQIEHGFCCVCAEQTKHVVVLVRKPREYVGKQNRSVKEFISGFVKSCAVGGFLASMDEFARHKICEQCGTKTIEN